jgi:cell division protein FtsN
MPTKKFVLVCVAAVLIGLAGCSRQQSDWQKTREANSVEAYEQFLKKYPSGEFTAQAQARLKELDEERDWQKARDADTLDAYQAFLKQYPDGKDTEEARIRVENFTLAQTPSGAGVQGGAPGTGAGAPGPAAEGGAPGAESGTGAAETGAGSAGNNSPAGGSHRATAGANAPATAVPTQPSLAKTAKPHRARSAESQSTPSGTYAVQLGAFKSGTEAANKRWKRLQKEYPKLFAGLSSKVVAKKTKNGTLYRLQAVGMTEAHAHRICKDLKAKSQPCVIVRPTRA